MAIKVAYFDPLSGFHGTLLYNGEGLTFETDEDGHLYVYRHGIQVGLFASGVWRYAQEVEDATTGS